MTATVEDHRVTKFKSMAIALKELEPFIRNGQHLQTGREFVRFGRLRSRELLGNWLVCAVLNAMLGAERITFASDPTGGDGLLLDLETGDGRFTEHVMVPYLKDQNDPIETRILAAIALKQGRGEDYARDKTLIVFLNAGDREAWFLNRVARQVALPVLFDAIWIVGLEGVDEETYRYAVTRLGNPHSPAWRLSIAHGFDGWSVQPVQ